MPPARAPVTVLYRCPSCGGDHPAVECGGQHGMGSLDQDALRELRQRVCDEIVHGVRHGAGRDDLQPMIKLMDALDSRIGRGLAGTAEARARVADRGPTWPPTRGPGGRYRAVR